MPAHHRRFFQFSLRTLLILMTALCLGPGGFVAYEQARCRRQQDSVAAIERAGGYLFDDENAAVRTGFWRILLGDDTCAHVVGVDFNPLKTENRQIVDADLNHLRSFPHLNHLVLKNCPNITAAGLAELSSLDRLQYLYLNDTPVNDAGLAHLASLSKLEELSLTHTRVTGSGLSQLSGLSNLQFLYLYSTSISPDATAQLQRALPNCRINR